MLEKRLSRSRSEASSSATRSDTSHKPNGLPRKFSENDAVQCIAVLHLVPPRFIGCRRRAIEQCFDDVGGENFACKFWRLTRNPCTSRHDFPIALADRRCLDSYLILVHLFLFNYSLRPFSSPRRAASSKTMQTGLPCIRTLRFNEQHLDRLGSQVLLGSRVSIDPSRRANFHVNVFRSPLGDVKRTWHSFKQTTSTSGSS
jgi:hypothetical protein